MSLEGWALNDCGVCLGEVEPLRRVEEWLPLDKWIADVRARVTEAKGKGRKGKGTLKGSRR